MSARGKEALMPNKVEDADKEADRIHKEMYPDQYPADEEGDIPNKDSEKNDDQESSSDEGKENVTVPAPSESDGTLLMPDAPVSESPAMEDFQQKYFVLKGKYDAEVPRLHSDLAALRTVVSDLQKQVSTKVLESKDDKPKEKPTNEALTFVEREYPDIYSAMVSLWEQGKDSKPSNQDAILQRIEAVERVAVSSAEDKFYRDLDAGVSDWRTHKDDPRFLDWLKEEDSLTGYTRMDLAQQAQGALDGKRVAKFYKAFVKDVINDNKVKQNPTETKPTEKDIGKFVAPPSSGGKGATGNTSADQNIIKTSDIKRFYDDANKGRYRGREDAFQKMEAKIDKAVANGSVVKD